MGTTATLLVSALILAAIAGGFRAINRALFDATRLPAAFYDKPSFVLAALADWRRNLVLIGLALPLAAAALGVMRIGFVSAWLGWWGPDWTVGIREGLGWSSFGQGDLLRILLTVTSIVPAWAYSTQARNQFFDRGHIADRLLLAVSPLGVWLHPVMVLPALLLSLWTIHQLLHPRCFSYAWTQVRVPLDLLIAFVACLYGRILFGIGTGMVLTVLLTVLAASYFVPGVCKVGVGPCPFSWLFHNRVSKLFVSACNYGFLGGLLGRSPERVVVRVGRALSVLDVPIAVFTLIVELGAILLLADHRAAMWILGGCIALHAGIALASGITFWKWCIPCGAMIWVLANLSIPTLNHVFTTEHLALSIVGAGLSPWWMKPVELGWEDTGLNSFFRIEAIGRSGAIYEVGRNFLAPYDIFLCQSRLFFLTDRPALLGTLGAQTRRAPEFRDLATAIDRTEGEESRLAPIRARYGRIALDEGMAVALDLFFARFFTRINEGRPTVGLPGVPPAPAHMFFGTRQTPFRRQEPVAMVRVRHVETFFTGQEVRALHDRIVRQVPIGAQQAAPARAVPGAEAPAPRIARARAG
jgi:hypothetical protein